MNSGSFEQITTSWLIEKTGGLINWKFTHIAQRSHFNVLGALHAITHELMLITNDTYINAESVCELLRKIAPTTAGIPITLVLDNAMRITRNEKSSQHSPQSSTSSCFFCHPIHRT